MIAEGIVFDIPFDMSSYSREDILERYTPFKESARWETERLEQTSSEVELLIDKDKLYTDDMVIIRLHPDKMSMLLNLYLTTGIFDIACPKLGRVDLVESGSMLFSYPFFPDNLDYSKKIEDAVHEFFRVSLFFLEMYGVQRLSEWKHKVISYVSTYFSFIDRSTFGNIGDKKIIKRVYKTFF